MHGRRGRFSCLDRPGPLDSSVADTARVPVILRHAIDLGCRRNPATPAPAVLSHSGRIRQAAQHRFFAQATQRAQRIETCEREILPVATAQERLRQVDASSLDDAMPRGTHARVAGRAPERIGNRQRVEHRWHVPMERAIGERLRLRPRFAGASIFDQHALERTRTACRTDQGRGSFRDRCARTGTGRESRRAAAST